MTVTETFQRDGFATVPNALTPQDVALLNGVIDEDMAASPDEWVHFSESFIQTVDILPRRPEFDRTIENPRILPLLGNLIGADLTFEEFSIIIRNPTTQGSDHKSWHRDIIRDFNRRFEIDAISVVYYLTDVTETDHCFSIIPGTHGPKAKLRPEDIEPGMEVDLIAPAGSAILFHARCLHSGKLKPNSRQRRTLHLYYSRLSSPRTSEWSRFPERLFTKRDASLPPHLYAKWNRTDIVNGTGRKPRDLDPAMGTAAMLKEVQRRANQRS